MSLLGAGLSSSMLRGDSETECLREELANASDVNEHVLLLPVTNLMKNLLHTHKNKHTGGFLPAGEQYIEEWSKLGFVANFRRFLE